MEHQSQYRTEPLPADAAEFYTPQPEPKPARIRMGAQAIDAVRAAGWYDYGRTEQPDAYPQGQ